jgi:uracil-DNA glycosylase
LGRFSMGKFLPYAKISQVHGKLHTVKWREKEFAVIPMYHPAASLRNGEVMRQESEDFLKLPAILKKLDEDDKKKVEEVRSEEKQLNLI